MANNQENKFSHREDRFCFLYVHPVHQEGYIVEARIKTTDQHGGSSFKQVDLLRAIGPDGAEVAPYVAYDNSPSWLDVTAAAISESTPRCDWPALAPPEPLSGSANLVSAKVLLRLPADSLPIVYRHQDGRQFGLRDVSAIEPHYDAYLITIEPESGHVSWKAVQAELEQAHRANAILRALEPVNFS